MSDLARLDAKLAAVAKGVESPRVIKAAGMAGKKAATSVANDVTGGDGRLSGWNRARGGLKLGVGYDQTGSTEVTLNLRPSGAWKVMEDGRKATGTITPRNRGRGRNRTRGKALMTPWGLRSSVSGSSTAGKSAITKATEQAASDAVRAANTEVGQILREVF